MPQSLCLLYRYESKCMKAIWLEKKDAMLWSILEVSLIWPYTYISILFVSFLFIKINYFVDVYV